MKKVLNSILLVSIFGSVGSIAQVKQEGTPHSFNAAYSSTFALQTYVPQTAVVSPDINKLQLEDIRMHHTAFDNPRIGALVATDLSFPSSGTFTTLNDGKQVWRAQIKVSGAPAVGLYYDKFHLPDGVKYYLYNANGKQILGAYTSANNTEDGQWVNEKVAGENVNIELDIDADVNVSDISLHINNVASFYGAINYLNGFQPDGTVQWAYNTTSPCEINAICSIGSAYAIQREASVHIEYVSGNYIYAGSGTMMNNTLQDCTPYVLTASHVEPTNSTSNTTFSTWMFYFNYETPTCTYTGSRPNPSQSVSGATFKARASYDSSNKAIVGDFLLLQLKTSVPAAYGAYLSGWDISTSTPTGTCIGFHHPLGDVKKVSTSSHVYANGDFNGGEADSHWSIAPFDNGGIEEGSSGSGLFNASGRLVGDLSGGNVFQPTCTDTNSYGNEMSNYGEYSKLTLNWLYVYQQPSSAATRLKDWLDPNNSGATTLDAIASTCYKTGVKQVTTPTNTATVFPNPGTGVFYINANMGNAASVNVEVYDIIGNRVLATTSSSALLDNFELNLVNNAPGMYIVRLSAGSTVITKKISIAK